MDVTTAVQTDRQANQAHAHLEELIEQIGSAIREDGVHLATVGCNSIVRIYGLNIQELIGIAQSRLTRWLTPAECQQFLHIAACPAAP